MEMTNIAISDLAATQRQLWRLITAPDGVRAALSEQGVPQAEGLGALIRSDAILPADTRLEIYANAYFYRIHDCLRRDYGALHMAIRDGGFHDLVTAYLIAHPPAHPSLRFAGARLPDFLRNSRAAAPFRKRWLWVADLAALEWALVDAFDALDGRVAVQAHFASTPPEDWEQLELSMQPALGLLTLDWPVHELREAYENGDAALARTPLVADRTRVLVWRRRERVFFRALEPLEAEVLAWVRSGSSFGSLCAFLARDRSDETAAALAAGFLARWLDDGLLDRAATGGHGA